MKKLAFSLLCLTAPSLMAAEMETRAVSMGSTGTASATPGAAALYNPALLGLAGQKPKTQVILPSVGVMLAADKDAQDAYQNMDDEDYFGNIEQAVSDINTAGNQSDFNAAAAVFVDNTRGLNQEFGNVSGEPLNAGASAFVAGASANSTLGFSVYANADALIEFTPTVSDCDRGLLGEYANLVESVSFGLVPPNESYNCGGNTFNLTDGTGELNDPANDLSSEIFVGAVFTSEIGVSLARAFDVPGVALSVGVTPKFVNLTSQVANPTMQDLDDDNYDLGDELEASEVDDDMVNLDVGVAARLLDSLTVGVTAKNLISKTFETAPDNNGKTHKFEIKPSASAGVAWHTGALTLAADMDLTKNKALFNDRETQYLGGGVEYNLFRFLDLRAGLRSNLAQNEGVIYTTGLGFNIFAFNLDLSAQANDSNAAAALQMSLNF